MSRLLAHACTSPRSRQPSWPRKGCVSAAGLRVASVACWPPDVARRPFVGCPFGRRTPGSLAHVRSPAGLDGHPAGARAGRARGSIPRGGAGRSDRLSRGLRPPARCPPLSPRAQGVRSNVGTPTSTVSTLSVPTLALTLLLAQCSNTCQRCCWHTVRTCVRLRAEASKETRSDFEQI